MRTRPDSFSTDPEAEAAGLPVPRLWRSRENRVVAGVLGGLAEKYGWEPFPVRILYGLLTIASGGLLVIPYAAIWAITRAHGPARSGPRLWRSRSKKIVAGVLGGLAEKLDVPATLVRLLYTALTVFSMGVPGVVLYLGLWAFTPAIDDPHERETLNRSS
jgi:phage shock protein PspC (stress-responsive transcriptional regulator)